MNKRIVIIACTMACSTGATPPPVSPPVQTHGIGNPPRPGPEPLLQAVTATVEPMSPASFTDEPFAGRHEHPVNPTVSGKRVRRTTNQTCFVEGQFPDDGTIRYPGQAPPEVPVDCPPEMNDTVYDLCHHGVVYINDDKCGCFVMGNPPPPMRSLSRCPVHASIEKAD